MIALKQTNKEYLLFVPPLQKDRARAIAGYRWNPNRRCWVYPKTLRVYDALIAEFREELPDADLPPPAFEADADTLAAEHARLVEENRALRIELAASYAGGSGDGHVNGHTNGVHGTVTRRKAEPREMVLLAARDAEIAALRLSLGQAEGRAIALADETATLKGQIEQAQAAPGPRPAPPADEHQKFIAFFRALALEAAGWERNFKEVLQSLNAPATFPRPAAAAVEALLRARLKLDDPAADFTALLGLAKLADLISPAGADLAAVVHHLATIDAERDATPGTVWARALLALYATALLWPELAAPRA